MRTITKFIIANMSLLLIAGSASVAANENNSRPDQQTSQIERSNEAEARARTRAQQAEGKRSSTANKHETQAREQAKLQRQEARASAQLKEIQARHKAEGMRTATTGAEINKQRPAMVARPAMPQRQLRATHSSFR